MFTDGNWSHLHVAHFSFTMHVHGLYATFLVYETEQLGWKGGGERAREEARTLCISPAADVVDGVLRLDELVDVHGVGGGGGGVLRG
jgi:hypothetical protein